MVDWLNDNSGAVQAVLVFALLVATVMYTRRQAKASIDQAKASIDVLEETRKARLREERPVLDIVAYPLIDQRMVKEAARRTGYTISNVGRGPALNIVALIWYPEHNILSMPGPPGVREPMGTLAAGSSVDSLYALAVEEDRYMREGQRPTVGLMKVEYEDLQGKRYRSIREVIHPYKMAVPALGRLIVEELED